MRNFSLLLLSFLLISCGATDDTGSTQTIENTVYSMAVPSSWTEVPSNSVDTSIPEKSFRIFQAGYTLGGIYPKISIVEENLLMATTSLQYAKDNISKAPHVAQGYTKLDEQDTTISGQATKIHVYEARPYTQIPQTLFIQTYLIKDKYRGYTISISTSPSETNYSKYISLLTSFVFKTGT